ncbi:hypothetical protein, partial [Endozoicomonas sp. SESOKO2]|uniref:hypothetical protein n=1 Tax=Endozoicomonas sp. SESOKO2 TaxID=2828743 RepID=UPI0021499491
MTNAPPNALSLAVAIAICSSVIGTQALADRRLQTKSTDIQSNGYAEFTRSEVIVRPTLGDDQQPIPKSFTTTYPDQAQARAGYDIPSEGFTDTLSGIVGGVSTVDLFETDDNDVAQKYTKVLKVGDEGVFRFTHNLAEEKLAIEVRNGMTDQESINAVRTQLNGIHSLEKFTKIASPEQLAGVLKVANRRAGNLGASNDYVALATVQVNEVKVNGRTFMRLIAGGDQPPELRRLDQSLFVNEETLLAAATSAYTQVHVLGEDLQQEALNELFYYRKPVGYVVYVEDETRAYPVPEGYPKLEVTEAPGEVIVFRGQKQNSADVAFVENLYNMFAEEFSSIPPSEARAQIRKDKVKSYQYVIRNRQMELLEGIAAWHNAQLNEDGQTTLIYEDELRLIAQFEYIQQALTNATPGQADEFELTVRQIEAAMSASTASWMHNQLEKHFGFKPVFRNLLSNRYFVENIHEVEGDNTEMPDDPLSEDESIAAKLTDDIPRQQIDDEPVQNRKVIEAQQNQLQKLQQEFEKTPEQEKQVFQVSRFFIKNQNAYSAAKLGIDDWDDTQPLEEQARLIKIKIHEIYTSMAGAGQPDEEAVKAKPTAIGGKRGIASVNQNHLGTLQFVHQRLQFDKTLADEEVREKLAVFEGYLGLVPENKDHLEARHQAIQKHLKQQVLEVQDLQLQQEIVEHKNHLQKLQQDVEQIPKLERRVYRVRRLFIRAQNAYTAAKLGIDDWDNTRHLAEQSRIIELKTHEIYTSMVAAGQPDEEAVKAKPTAIGGKRVIASVNKNHLSTLQFVHQQLQQDTELSDDEVREKLAIFEGYLGLVPDNKDHLEARHQAIQQYLEQLELEIDQQYLQFQQEQEKQKSLLQKLQQRIEQIPKLEQQVRDAIEDAKKARNAQTAAKLGIRDWDENQPLEEQVRLIGKKMHEIIQAVPATSTTIEQPGEDDVEAKQAPIEFVISPRDEKGPRTRLDYIQQFLQQMPDPIDEEARLAKVETLLGLVPKNEDDHETRHQAIKQHLKQRGLEAVKRYVENQKPEEKKTWAQNAHHLIDLNPSLEKQVLHARAEATNNRNAEIAAELGIDDWDNTQLPWEQARLIREKIRKFKQLIPATGQPDEEAVRARPATIGSKRSITSINEDDQAVAQFIRQQLQQDEKLAEEEARKKLAFFESKLDLIPENKDDLAARHQNLRERISQQFSEAYGQHLLTQQELAGRRRWLNHIQEEVERIPILRKEVREAVAATRQECYVQIAAALEINNWDVTWPPEKQARLIIEKVHEIKRQPAATSITATSITATSIATTSIATTSIAATPVAATPVAATSIAATSIAATSTALKPVVATDSLEEQPGEEAVKEALATIESKLDITPDNENDLHARFHSIQQQLEQNEERTNRMIQNNLADIELKLGLVPDNGKTPEVRHQAIMECLKQLIAQVDQAHHKLTTMDDELEIPHQRVETLRDQKDFEGSFTPSKKGALATVPGIEQAEDTTSEDLTLLELKVRGKLIRIKVLERELADMRTPGHPIARSEVLETLSDVEEALEMSDLDESNDVHLRRQKISEHMHAFIREARQRIEEEALNILKAVEEILTIEVNEEDDKTTRFSRVRKILDDNDLPNYMADKIDSTLWATGGETPDEKHLKLKRLLAHLHYKVEGPEPDEHAREQQTEQLAALEEILNIKSEESEKAERFARVVKILRFTDIPEYTLDQIDQSLWKEDSKALSEWGLKLRKLRASLAYKIEDSYLDKQARKRQSRLLNIVEDELDIDIIENVTAKEKGKALTAKLADELKVEFEEGDLSYQKEALKAKVQTLMDEVDESYDDADAKQARNNEVAHQLNIEGYKDDATIENQNRLIEAKLKQLFKEILNAGKPDVHSRIATIEKELDMQMARLGPKPRYVLDRELAVARRAIEEAERELSGVYHKLKKLQGKQLKFVIHDTITPISEEGDTALNRAMKRIQTDLGLPAGDEQPPEERLEDISHFLQRYGAERLGHAANKLKAVVKNLHILVKEGDLGSLKEAYNFAIKVYSYAHGWIEPDARDNALNELTSIRKKYTQVTEFLHEHVRKTMEVTHTQLEELNAQENLNRKKQEIEHPGYIDEQAKTAHNKEMAALASVLEQKREAVSKAEEALTDHHKAALDATEKALGLKPDVSDTHEQRLNALRERQIKLGGADGTGGRIKILQEQARLEGEIKTRKADIERMEEVLKTAEEAVKNDGGPFQFTPEQEKARGDILKFVQQHPLKQQALEAAMGLTEAAVKNGKTIPFLTTFDFDDEFAPIRLQTIVGDNLSFDQACRIVEVFKSLKRNFPVYPFEPLEGQPQNVLTKIEGLVNRARNEIKTAAQQYDDEIHGMGLKAIHYIEHESIDLKGFTEYFTTRSATGRKIIALLGEGLISKVELDNYIKAVRGIDGYQPVEEFEHFLGYKHGINVAQFSAVVQMLSDRGTEEFMQGAFTTLTATGPAGMKESVEGMKEYAAAVIANYVLDDIA